MSAASSNYALRPYDRIETSEADAMTVLCRLMGDMGARFLELAVHDEEGDTRLLSCGDPAYAVAPSGRLHVDEVDGETLFLSLAYTSADTPKSLLVLSDRLHPAIMAFFRSWWQCSRTLKRYRQQQALLGRSDHGWILLDAQHRIIWMNAAADRLLANADMIHRSGPSIAASAMTDTIALRRIMTDLTMVRVGRRLMLLSREKDRPPVTVIISALPALTERDGAMLAVQIVDTQCDRSSAVALVGEAYRLSAAEKSITAHLAAGDSIVEAAQKMGIKPSTARTYLQSIFIKANVKSQASLMRLFLLSNPS